MIEFHAELFLKVILYLYWTWISFDALIPIKSTELSQGSCVGTPLGIIDGEWEGGEFGTVVGLVDGKRVELINVTLGGEGFGIFGGTDDSKRVGLVDGILEGVDDGNVVGLVVGVWEGVGDGNAVGLVDGI